MEHCKNFDAGRKDCLECPGKVNVIQRDGSIDTICRAGEAFVRRLIASSEIPTTDNDLPIFKIPFPAQERPA